jgi:hypothetical protein
MDVPDTILDEFTQKNTFDMDMSREWTQNIYQKIGLTVILKERKNEAVPEEPGTMGYIQP